MIPERIASLTLVSTAARLVNTVVTVIRIQCVGDLVVYLGRDFGKISVTVSIWYYLSPSSCILIDRTVYQIDDSASKGRMLTPGF